jgi:hypothetical protein
LDAAASSEPAAAYVTAAEYFKAGFLTDHRHAMGRF